MHETGLVPFGAEVLNAQMNDFSASDADNIIDTVSRHRVVVFRQQNATDTDLVRFLNLLGSMMFTAGETPVAGAEDLNIVSNVGRVTPPRSVFHTDTSYLLRPPSFGALREVSLPTTGGGTHFSDQVKAASALPINIKNWLRGRTVLHQVRAADGTMQQAHHPLLRRHAVTGEISLFISTPERCSAISGVDEPTSKRIVELLYRHSTRKTGRYQHKWQFGDIVVWDNRVTLHRADHRDVSGDRTLHRGLVLGEEPIPW